MNEFDIEFLKKALAVGENCFSVPFYGVGCLIVSPSGDVISSGYTGEMKYLEENQVIFKHAEEVALIKAKENGDSLEGATLYSTMEPCSERKSGKAPCAALIIGSGIKRVVYGTREPFDPALGINCKGDVLLSEAGIEVVHIRELEEECLKSVLSKRA